MLAAANQLYTFFDVSSKCISKISQILSNVLWYWGAVDAMWCFIYYHSDLNKRCWRETCKHSFRPLKLFSAKLNRFSKNLLWWLFTVTYLTSFAVGTTDFIRASPDLLIHVFWCYFDQAIFKTGCTGRKLSDSKNKFLQQNIN